MKNLHTKNFRGPTRVVLTYYPLGRLPERQKQRNRKAIESGSLNDQRVGTFPLMQFGELYTQVEKGKKSLETINRAQTVKSLSESYDLRIDQLRREGDSVPSKEKIQTDKECERRDLLKRLGFTDENTMDVQVGPRDPDLYDMIVDTRNSSESIAEMLHNET